MTQLLEQALETARNLPSAAQDDIARLILRLAGREDAHAAIPLSPGERDAIAVSMAAAARGEFATSAQIQAVWEKHGL